MTAPVPSDIDAPADEADGLVERLLVGVPWANGRAMTLFREAAATITQLRDYAGDTKASEAFYIQRSNELDAKLESAERMYRSSCSRADHSETCLEAANSRLATAERERDEAVQNADTVCNSYADENQRLFDKVEAAEAKVLALTTALTKIGKIVHEYGVDYRTRRVTLGAYEACAEVGDIVAHAALEQAKPAAALSPDKGA